MSGEGEQSIRLYSVCVCMRERIIPGCPFCGITFFPNIPLEKRERERMKKRKKKKQNKIINIRKQRTNEAFSSSWTAYVYERERIRG